MSRELSLREIQLIQLDIGKEISRICSKNNIPYFIIGGTLLGAVRHRGFIPWDDDMDIGMTIDNYNRFVSVARNELGSQFIIQEWNDGSGYSYPFAKVKMKGTTVVELVSQSLNLDKGIWVDIFPYMPISKKKALSKIFMIRLQLLSKTFLLKNGYDLSALTQKPISKLINYVLKLCPIRANYCKRKFLKLIKNNKSDEYYLECDGMFKGNFVFPQDYFKTFTELPFEDVSFMAPGKYDAYLKDAYGDYMVFPPEEERNKGHSLVSSSID